MTNTKLCYCQSARHARAAVAALVSAGIHARSDKSGYIFVNSADDRALSIANSAIKACR